MKYLKTFEDRDRYTRDTVYKYLDTENTIKVKEFVKSYIDSLNIMDKIGNLKIVEDFEVNNFDYELIFNNFFSNNHYSAVNNIYYAVDTFCHENGIPSSGPALRNSLGNIIEEIYKDYNKKGLKEKLDKKLISLLEKKPKNYKDVFFSFEDELNDEVKNACEWMLNFKKYNL